MTIYQDTWARIEEVNKAVGWPSDWSVAERDEIDALAEELDREFFGALAKSSDLRDNESRGNCVALMLDRAAQLGWRYVDSRSCPRRLVGKRCKGTQCWCGHSQIGASGNLNDHGATWFCEGGWGPKQSKFVLWEPYAARGELVAEILSAAEQDGLAVFIMASVWNPPKTVGIMFYPACLDR